MGPVQQSLQDKAILMSRPLPGTGGKVWLEKRQALKQWIGGFDVGCSDAVMKEKVTIPVVAADAKLQQPWPFMCCNWKGPFCTSHLAPNDVNSTRAGKAVQQLHAGLQLQETKEHVQQSQATFSIGVQNKALWLTCPSQASSLMPVWCMNCYWHIFSLAPSIQLAWPLLNPSGIWLLVKDAHSQERQYLESTTSDGKSACTHPGPACKWM